MDANEIKQELEAKKKLYSSIKLSALPDKGVRIKKQIDNLEAALEKLNLSDSVSEGSTKDLPANVPNDIKADNNVSTEHVPEVSDLKTRPSNNSEIRLADTLKNDVTEQKNVPNTKSVNAKKFDSHLKVRNLGNVIDDPRVIKITPLYKSVTSNSASCSISDSNSKGPSIPTVDRKIITANDGLLSFADVKAKHKIFGKEPPLIPKSPAFTGYRTKDHVRKVQYTEAAALPQNLLKAQPKFLSLGFAQQCDYGLARAKEAAVETIHDSLVTCPLELSEEREPQGLKTALMKHQKQALTWLLWRENKEPRGGIFADDMGLGKTLTMLALILKSKEQKLNSSTDDENANNGPTLIVCITSILHQWHSEVIKHCKINALRVLVYHGPKREAESKKFGFYDVVITTYNLILSEGKASKQKNKSSQLFTTYWQRIILDEAHTIKNPKSQTAQWIFQLNSISRWAVTGTPIHNDLKDLYCLLKYLRCRPFDDYQVWKKLINDFSETSEKRRNALMKSILLRRCKNEKDEAGNPLVPLPGKHIKIHKIELSELEMEIYNRVYSRLQPKINDCFSSRTSSKSVSSKGAALLTLLLKLQQCCNHPFLVKSSTYDDVDTSLDSVGSVLSGFSSLNIGESESSLEASSEMNLSIVEEDFGFAISEESSKVKYLLKKLHKILKRNEKVVIVSQWVATLDIISHHLTKSCISHTVIKGSTKPEERSKTSEDFNCNPSGPPVLLLSLKAGGVGLNLVGGNHMFLLDLHWNPALEMQASDRIYRVGQKKEVFVHKFVCKSTIEEKIFEMQEQKQRIAEVVLEGAKSDNHLTMTDLKELFNI